MRRTIVSVFLVFAVYCSWSEPLFAPANLQTLKFTSFSTTDRVIPKDISIRWFEYNHEGRAPTIDSREIGYLDYIEDGARVVRAGWDIGFYLVDESSGNGLLLSGYFDELSIEVINTKDNSSPSVGKIVADDLSTTAKIGYLSTALFDKSQINLSDLTRPQYRIHVKVKIKALPKKTTIDSSTKTSQVTESYPAEVKEAVFSFKNINTRILVDIDKFSNAEDLFASLLSNAYESQVGLSQFGNLNTVAAIGYVPLVRYEARRSDFWSSCIDNINIGFSAAFGIANKIDVKGYGGGVGLLITKSNKSVFQTGFIFSIADDKLVWYLGADPFATMDWLRDWARNQ